MATLNIDGKEYDLESLPQEVKSQLSAVQQCDQKIISWNMNIALAQTARGAYAAEIKLLLEKFAVDVVEKVEVVEVEEVDEVDEVKILSAEEVDEVEVLEAKEIEANR